MLFLVCGVTASVRHALSRKRNALRSRRREEAYVPDENTDGSRLTDVQNFENVQDEFKEILDRHGELRHLQSRLNRKIKSRKDLQKQLPLSRKLGNGL